MCTEKNDSIRNEFTNELSMSLSLRTRVEKTVHGVESHSLINVLSAAVSKEGHADASSEALKDQSITISLKKRCNYGSASNCLYLLKDSRRYTYV